MNSRDGLPEIKELSVISNILKSWTCWLQQLEDDLFSLEDLNNAFQKSIWLTTFVCAFLIHVCEWWEVWKAVFKMYLEVCQNILKLEIQVKEDEILDVAN